MTKDQMRKLYKGFLFFGGQPCPFSVIAVETAMDWAIKNGRDAQFMTKAHLCAAFYNSSLGGYNYSAFVSEEDIP
jgi:hypothetical protein